MGQFLLNILISSILSENSDAIYANDIQYCSDNNRKKVPHYSLPCNFYPHLFVLFLNNEQNMKKLLLVTFILSASVSFGQSKTTSSENAYKGFQLGLNASPDFCYRTLQNNSEDPSLDGLINMRNEKEGILLSYSSGISAAYQFNQCFGIETGLSYAVRGLQSKKTASISPPDPAVPEYFKHMYYFHFIDIPLKANFIFGENKLRFIASVGVTTNIFLKETATTILFFDTHTDKHTFESTDPYRTLNFSPTLSAGIDWNFRPNVNLRVEPSFQFSALKIIDTPVSGRLYSAGLKMSMYYRL
jgi:hypothetical protein